MCDAVVSMTTLPFPNARNKDAGWCPAVAKRVSNKGENLAGIDLMGYKQLRPGGWALG